MDNLSEQQLRILVGVLAFQDTRREPNRGGHWFPHDSHRRIAYQQLRWQELERFRADGVTYLGTDRTSTGRTQTATMLSGLARLEVLSVRFTAGRPSRVALTPAGDELARRVSGQPTRKSSAGCFYRLCRMLEGKKLVKQWPPAKVCQAWFWRRHSVFEYGLAYPTGCTDHTQPGVVGQVSGNIAPWLAAELVEWHDDTTGLAFYRPTELGWDYFKSTRWNEHNLEWLPAWEAEQAATADEIGPVLFDRLQEHFNESFARERQTLRNLHPEAGQEIGIIPWGRTDDFN